MKNWLLRWVASALALFVITQAHVGISVQNPLSLLFAVLALGLVNSLIRPLIMLLVWPINCLTFGLLGFAVNVILFYLVGKNLPGFTVRDLPSALIGSVAMGLLSGLFNFFLKDRGDRDNR